MNKPRIVTDPQIMFGKPVISGTRITVESILERLAAGESPEQILKAFPRLTRASFRAALAYAADEMHSVVTYSTPNAAK